MHTLLDNKNRPQKSHLNGVNRGAEQFPEKRKIVVLEGRDLALFMLGSIAPCTPTDLERCRGWDDVNLFLPFLVNCGFDDRVEYDSFDVATGNQTEH